MPHSIGHYIGFKTHDVGFQRQPPKEEEPKPDATPAQPLTKDQLKMYEPITRDVLRANIVTTIEPGIYFIEILKEKAKSKPELAEFFDFDKYEEYMDVGGVRIEDDILVTETGHCMLTEVGLLGAQDYRGNRKMHGRTRLEDCVNTFIRFLPIKFLSGCDSFLSIYCKVH